MTIANVAAGNTLPATKVNEMILTLNTLNNGRVIILTGGSGVFTWPTGIDAIEVILCGGGGRCGNSWTQSNPSGGAPIAQPISRGGDSPLCSKILTGIDPGTSIPVVVGAAGTGTAAGGTTSFGAGQSYGFQSTGGTGGNSGTAGTDGTHTGDLRYGNQLFIYNRVGGIVIGYGEGFPGNTINAATSGGPGIIVVRY